MNSPAPQRTTIPTSSLPDQLRQIGLRALLARGEEATNSRLTLCPMPTSTTCASNSNEHHNRSRPNVRKLRFLMAVNTLELWYLIAVCSKGGKSHRSPESASSYWPIPARWRIVGVEW